MRLAELRGFIAFLLAVGGIAFAWNQIENRPVAVPVAAVTTTTTTTTTTVRPTLTTPQQATAAICSRSEQFAAVVAALPADAGPGPTAQLAYAFWAEVLDLADPQLRTEVVAVVSYYRDYLDLAQPFGFNAAKIIVDGDKERFQQLVTRPAPGLAVARDVISLACGVEVPDKPSMRSKVFTDLENRLLFPDEEDT